MRVVVLCADPEAAERDPESTPQILRDLGCDVLVARFDTGGLDDEALLARPVDMVIVDSADDVVRGQRALRYLERVAALAQAPALLTITPARLPALDFSAGAADFILSPIVPAELYARLRQLDWRNAAFRTEEVLKIDELVVDVAGFEARVGGRPLPLTHQEFELLRYLAQHRGKAFTREQLLTRVWGYRYGGGSRTVDIHVRRLRAKLGPTLGGLIETVRHVGYKLRGGG